MDFLWFWTHEYCFSVKSLCMDPSGHLINYRLLRSHPLYNDLCELTKQLSHINLDTVTENERKTFFISNAFAHFSRFVLHSLIESMLSRSVQCFNHPWHC